LYITLKRVVDRKTSLRTVFCHTKWERSHLSTKSKGKNVEETMPSNSFWKNVICGPIVDVPHMVDGDMPCMGFIYESTNHCKEAIASALIMWKLITEIYGR
jgi:hypothetical protein